MSARRPSVVMSFPARLGTVLPLDSVVNASHEGGYPTCEEHNNVLLPGTLLYSPRSVPDKVAIGGGEHGCLYMLLSPYDGKEPPECAELLRGEQ